MKGGRRVEIPIGAFLGVVMVAVVEQLARMRIQVVEDIAVVGQMDLAIDRDQRS